MNQSFESITWVQLTSAELLQSWHRTSALLATSAHQERNQVLSNLKAGQLIRFERSGITIQCVPMTAPEHKRLAYLLSLEQQGFQLVAFRSDMALYDQGDLKYSFHSMNELSERGILPKPTIIINRLNTPILNLNGSLLDVFVPLGEEATNFYWESRGTVH